MSDLLSVLQEINQNGMKGMKLTDLCFGTVATVSPLTITLEGTMQPLPTAALELTWGVKNSITATDSGGTVVPIILPLAVGDRVIMMRCAHGQRFLVVSKA